jgi:TolA-binding protein
MISVSFRRVLRTAIGAALLAATASSLVACSAGGKAASSTETGTSTAAAAPTTTGPEPITAQEEEWIHDLTKLQKRLEKTAFQGGVITRSRLLSEARAYDRCKSSLGAEPSTRFHKPYELAKNACRRFHKAAVQLRKAAAAADASGAVVAGTEQQRIFDRAIERGTANAGNAVNRMSDAVARAEAVKESLPS